MFSYPDNYVWEGLKVYAYTVYMGMLATDMLVTGVVYMQVVKHLVEDTLNPKLP